MNTKRNPQILALALTSRSDLKTFHLGSVIFDNRGVFAWGWNHWKEMRKDSAKTLCAERHALFGANRKRLYGATIVVAGRKKRSGKVFLTRPCNDCYRAIKKAGIKKIIYSEDGGTWKKEFI